MSIKIKFVLKTAIVAHLALLLLPGAVSANPPDLSPFGTPSAIATIPQGSTAGTINLDNGDVLHYTTVNPCPQPADCLNSTSIGTPRIPNGITHNATFDDRFTNTQTTNGPIINPADFLFLDTPTE